jgi:hypothetical protein
MYGLIIDAHSTDSLREFRPGQQPIFYAGGHAVFEIWFWDHVARLWFVMVADPARVAEQGAVGFHPLHTKEQITVLRDQWRQHRARGGHGPSPAPRH